MILKYRKWRVFLENDSKPLSHIASYPSLPLWADCNGLGWAWTASDDFSSTFQPGQNSTPGAEECDCCLLSPGLPSVSLCPPSQMCHSINDWCLPIGLDSSFTCSLLHSCSLSSAPAHMHEHTEPCAAEYKLLRGVVVFTESKRLMYHMHHALNHFASSISLPAEFPPLHVWIYRSGEDSADTHESRRKLCLFSNLFMRINAFIQYMSAHYCHFPRSTQLKRHFSAAEAIIPCCQSLLCCRSCICSGLVLCIWCGGSLQCSFTHQWNSVSLHMNLFLFPWY